MGENNYALVFCLRNLFWQVQNTSSFLWLFYQIFIWNTWQPPQRKKRTKNSDHSDWFSSNGSVENCHSDGFNASVDDKLIRMSTFPDRKDPRSTSITHRSHTFVWDWCLIDVDPRVFAIWVSFSNYIDCLVQDCTHLAKTFGSTSIRHRSDTSVSDRCFINVDPMGFVSRQSQHCIGLL